MILSVAILKKYRAFIAILLCVLFCSCSNLDVQKLNNKASELMQQGDIDGAIARLESIQDLNPNFPQTNYNLGLAYKEKQDLERAVKYLERSIHLKPDFYQAHISLSVINEELADQLISSELEKLQEQKPNDSFTVDDIELTVEQKQKLYNYYKKARASIEAYLQTAPAVEGKNGLEEKMKEYDSFILKYSVPEDNSSVEEDKKKE